MSHPSPRRPALRRAALSALVPLLALLLHACVQRPGPDAGEVVRTLDSAEPVLGATVEIGYDPAALAFEGLEPAPGLLARVADDGRGTVRVALVASEPLEGALAELRFDRRSGDAVPVVRSASTVVDRDGRAGEGLALGEGGAPLAAAGGGLEPLDEGDSATCRIDLVYTEDLVDRPLGDLNANGALDIPDAIALLDAVVGNDDLGTPERCYHADLHPPAWTAPNDGTDVVNTQDVVALLDILVAPDAPPVAHVRPSPASFEQLRDGVVLVGNLGGGSLEGVVLELPNGETVGPASAGPVLAFDLEAEASWVFGWIEARGGDVVPVTSPAGSLVILIGGQSNAVAWGRPVDPGEFENPAPEEIRQLVPSSETWRAAEEPLDPGSGHSAGLRASALLLEAVEREQALVPAARGGSDVVQWLPDASQGYYDRMIRRARISSGEIEGAEPSEGGPASVLYWYQGEANRRSATDRNRFAPTTRTVWSEAEADLGVPIVFAQLAAWNPEVDALNPDPVVEHWKIQDVAERQRRMEEGALLGTPPSDEDALYPSDAIHPYEGAHMIVTNDLPMSDGKHLSSAGQCVLAERLSLAVREHVLGEDVDGTGPRLVGLGRAGTREVRLSFDRPVRYDDAGGLTPEGPYFRAYAGDPREELEADGAYGMTELGVTGVREDPSNASAVLVTLEDAPPAGSDLYLRYAPPPGRVPDETAYPCGPEARGIDGEDGLDELLYRNVIRGVTEHALPLPTFGPLRVP